MGKVILPVGKDMGPYYDEGSLRPSKHPQYRVNAGKKFIGMDEEEYRVWGTPFLAARRYSEFDFDATALTQVVHELGGVSSPGGVVKELQRVGALIEIDIPLHEVGDLSAGLVEFLKGYRLIPVGDALGNSQASPDSYMIGRGGTGVPLAVVTGDAYWIWANNLTYSSLWAACASLTTDLKGDSPHIPARELVTFLPQMVTTVCAYLEPVRGDRG